MRVTGLDTIIKENTRLTLVASETLDTAFKDAFLLQFDDQYDKWKPELGNRDEVFNDFVQEHMKEIKQIINADLALKLIDETKRENYTKVIKIETIYIIAMLQLEILGRGRNRVIDEYISELVRKNLQNASCLCFRVGKNGRIEV